MIIRQLSVFLENKKGRLCAAAEVLAQNNVNIRALSLADTSEFGMLRLVVDKPEEGCRVLKESGVFVSITDVLAVPLDDRPGGTLAILRLMDENNIDVEYMYACVGKTSGKALMILRVSDMEKAGRVLAANGFGDLDAAEVYPIE